MMTKFILLGVLLFFVSVFATPDCEDDGDDTTVDTYNCLDAEGKLDIFRSKTIDSDTETINSSYDATLLHNYHVTIKPEKKIVLEFPDGITTFMIKASKRQHDFQVNVSDSFHWKFARDDSRQNIMIYGITNYTEKTETWQHSVNLTCLLTSENCKLDFLKFAPSAYPEKSTIDYDDKYGYHTTTTTTTSTSTSTTTTTTTTTTASDPSESGGSRRRDVADLKQFARRSLKAYDDSSIFIDEAGTYTGALHSGMSEMLDCYSHGDVNQDGVLDMADVDLYRQWLSKDKPSLNVFLDAIVVKYNTLYASDHNTFDRSNAMDVADLDGDGIVTRRDMDWLFRLLHGDFPCVISVPFHTNLDKISVEYYVQYPNIPALDNLIAYETRSFYMTFTDEKGKPLPPFLDNLMTYNEVFPTTEKLRWRPPVPFGKFGLIGFTQKRDIDVSDIFNIGVHGHPHTSFVSATLELPFTGYQAAPTKAVHSLGINVLRPVKIKYSFLPWALGIGISAIVAYLIAWLRVVTARAAMYGSLDDYVKAEENRNSNPFESPSSPPAYSQNMRQRSQSSASGAKTAGVISLSEL